MSPAEVTALGELRREISTVAGEVSAVDANVSRLYHSVDRLEAKVDQLLGLKSRADDHTTRIQLLEQTAKNDQNWANRLAWLWAGAVTAAAGVFAVLKLIGK